MALSPTRSERDALNAPLDASGDAPLSPTAAPSSPTRSAGTLRSRSPWRHNSKDCVGKGGRGPFASPASSPRRGSTFNGMQSAPASPFLGFAANLSPLATRVRAAAGTPVFPRLGCSSQGIALDATAIATATAAVFPPSQPPSATPSPNRRRSHLDLFLTSPNGNSRGSGMGLSAIDGGLEGDSGDDGISMAMTMGLGVTGMSMPLAPDSPGKFPVNGGKGLFRQVCLNGGFGSSLPSSPARLLFGCGIVAEHFDDVAETEPLQFASMTEEGLMQFGGDAATRFPQQLLSAREAASAAGAEGAAVAAANDAAGGEGGDFAPARIPPLGGALRMDFGHLGFVVDSGRAHGGGGGGGVTGRKNFATPLNASKRLREQLVSDPNLRGKTEAAEGSKRRKKGRNGSGATPAAAPAVVVSSRSATIAAKEAAARDNRGRLGGGRSDDSFESNGSSSGDDSCLDEEDEETARNRQRKRLHSKTAALLLPLPPIPRAQPVPLAATAVPRAATSSGRSGRKLAGAAAAASRSLKNSSAVASLLPPTSGAAPGEEEPEHTLSRLESMRGSKAATPSPAAAAAATAAAMPLAPPPPILPLLSTAELAAASSKAAGGRAAASNVHNVPLSQQCNITAANLDGQLRSPPPSTRGAGRGGCGSGQAETAASAARSCTPRDRGTRRGGGDSSAAAAGAAAADLVPFGDIQTTEPAIFTPLRVLPEASSNDTLVERRRNSACDYAATAAPVSAGVVSSVTAGEAGDFGGFGSGGEAVKRTCNCRRSRCLKRYCDCFASNARCRPECKCHQCLNTSRFETEHQQAVRVVLERNPNAFQDKKVRLGAGDAASVAHNMGCNCKKSWCLKRYCECYQLGLRCGERCKCSNCHNYHGNAELAKSLRSAAARAKASAAEETAGAAAPVITTLTGTAAVSAAADGTEAAAAASTEEAGMAAVSTLGATEPLPQPAPAVAAPPVMGAVVTVAAAAASAAAATQIATGAAVDAACGADAAARPATVVRMQYAAAVVTAAAASAAPTTAAIIMTSPQPAVARSSAPALRSSAAAHRTRPPQPAASTPLPLLQLRTSPGTNPRASNRDGGSSSSSSRSSSATTTDAAGSRQCRPNDSCGGPPLPVFGAALPAVDKSVALTVLAHLDGKDRRSACLVSPLWSGLAFDDAMWQQ